MTVPLVPAVVYSDAAFEKLVPFLELRRMLTVRLVLVDGLLSRSWRWAQPGSMENDSRQ